MLISCSRLKAANRALQGDDDRSEKIGHEEKFPCLWLALSMLLRPCVLPYNIPPLPFSPTNLCCRTRRMYPIISLPNLPREFAFAGFPKLFNLRRTQPRLSLFPLLFPALFALYELPFLS